MKTSTLAELEGEEVAVIASNRPPYKFTGKLFRDWDGSYQAGDSFYFHPLHVAAIIGSLIILK